MNVRQSLLLRVDGILGVQTIPGKLDPPGPGQRGVKEFMGNDLHADALPPKVHFGEDGEHPRPARPPVVDDGELVAEGDPVAADPVVAFPGVAHEIALRGPDLDEHVEPSPALRVEPHTYWLHALASRHRSGLFPVAAFEPAMPSEAVATVGVDRREDADRPILVERDGPLGLVDRADDAIRSTD